MTENLTYVRSEQAAHVLQECDMRPSDARAELLARVASLYYERDMDQSAIARELGMSRSNVSRLLKEARERGIVQVRVFWPLSRHLELERHLQQAFDLPQAIILAGRDIEEDEAHARVGELAARYLDSVLEPDTILGVSWGRAIHELVHAFSGRARPGVTVVQMMGGVGSANPTMDGSDLARRLADAIGGTYHYLQAPLVVRDSLVKDALLQEASISQVLDLARRAQIALVGIGGVEPGQTSLLRAGYISLADLERVKHEGAVGEICGRYFDSEGRICQASIDDRVMGIELEALKEKERVIAVVCGGGKAAAVLGTLRGRFVHTLVTDERCAVRVLEIKRSACR